MKPSSTSTGQQISLQPLPNHELFEKLYTGAKEDNIQYPILINFSANWCGPCKKIDWGFLLDEFGDRFASIYKCDVDENKYTPGFCGVKSIPSWIILRGPKQVEGAVQISDTAKVASWIFTSLTKK